MKFPASIQQRKALKTQPRCAQPLLNSLIAHTTPTGNIPETPELGIPLYNGQNVSSQWCQLLRGSTVQFCTSEVLQYTILQIMKIHCYASQQFHFNS